MIVVIIAEPGETGCVATLTLWKGSGTPAANYNMTEVADGVYESADIVGLVGEFRVSMANGDDELVYVGYVNFDGSERGQADDQPVTQAPPSSDSMIVVVIAEPGETGCVATLTLWKGSGTPAANYPMTEVADGVYESSPISGLVGEFRVSMANGDDELVYLGYVNFDGSERGQADDQPVTQTASPVTPDQLTRDDRIAEIDAILASGASSVTVDGTTSTYNLEQLRKERLELLKRKESGMTAGQRRRPYIMRPFLG